MKEERGTGEKQETLFRIKTPESFRRGPGHECPVQIMDLVMPDGPAVCFMPERPVVFRIVGDAVERVLESPHGLIVHIPAPELLRPAERGGYPVVRIEQRGFVHVVPESFHTGFQQGPVQIAEPASGIFPQEIREAADAGPDSGGEVRTVFFFAEETAGFA